VFLYERAIRGVPCAVFLRTWYIPYGYYESFF
jgi:hypothetical protein